MRILVAGFGLVGIYGLLRFVESLRLWSLLETVAVQPGPLYTAISGGLLALVGLAVTLALALRWPQADPLARLAVLALAAGYWAERLILSRKPEDWLEWPFALGLTLLALAYTFGVLAWLRRRARSGI
jgi:hypothetical protein